jgi:hypothetical protein
MYELSSHLTELSGSTEDLSNLKNSFFPSLFLFRTNGAVTDYAGFRLAIKGSKSETTVPYVPNSGGPVPGETVQDETREQSSLFDMEVGKLKIKELKSFKLAYGGGVYLSVARRSFELSTVNDLSAYENRVISSDTRLRGGGGLRPRLELHTPRLGPVSLAFGATYQVGFVSLPEVVSRSVAYVNPNPEPQVIQQTENLKGFSWTTSDTVDLWFRIDFRIWN